MKTSLRTAGFATLAQLAAATPAELRRLPGIDTSAAGHIASAQAWTQEAAVWLKPPAIGHDKQPIYFDLETIPFRDQPWSIGWQADGTAPEIIITAADCAGETLMLPDGQRVHLVSDAAALWEAFAALVPETPGPLVHWSPFDATILRKTAPSAVQAALLPRVRDLYAIMNKSVRLPVFGASLKVIAPYLGFTWSRCADWEQAFNSYTRWQRTGDLAALTDACAYQRDDVLALGVIWHWLRMHSPR